MQRDAMLRQSALTDPQTPADQLSAASRAGWDVVQPGEPLILRRGDRERVMPLTLLAGWVARGCPDREPVDALAVLYALPGTVTELRRRRASEGRQR